MKRKIEQAPKMDHPVMIDRVIGCIQDELVAKIGWLDHAFGRAQRLATKQENGIRYYPGVHYKKNEYLDMLPGDEYGNRTFFVVEDPQQIVEFLRFGHSTIKSPFALIGWYDLASIFKGNTERNTEEIKRQILNVLARVRLPNGAHIEIERIYERADNIFRGYSISEVQTQFMMNPYAAIRIEGSITYQEDCL